jgi:hypothetical protein
MHHTYDRVQKLFYAIALCLVAGCGRNHSGRYEASITSQRKCYVLASGQCVDINSMEGMMNSPFMAASAGRAPARTSFRTVTTHFILTLKEENSDITGNLVVTDDQSLKEFVIRTGSVDQKGQLHLKLTLKPDAQVGASAFGFSLSGGLTEMLLNLDQVDGKKGELAFQVTDSVNLLGGLLRQSSGTAEKLVFSPVKGRA